MIRVLANLLRRSRREEDVKIRYEQEDKVRSKSGVVKSTMVFKNENQVYKSCKGYVLNFENVWFLREETVINTVLNPDKIEKTGKGA